MSEYWVSISVIGDPWEVEMDVYAPDTARSKYRFRSAMFGQLRTEWSIGRPPTGFHAQPSDPPKIEWKDLKCPSCGAKALHTKKRPNGNTTCVNGHIHLASQFGDL